MTRAGQGGTCHSAITGLRARPKEPLKYVSPLPAAVDFTVSPSGQLVHLDDGCSSLQGDGRREL